MNFLISLILIKNLTVYKLWMHVFRISVWIRNVKHLYFSRSRYLINNKINNDVFYSRYETQSRTKHIMSHQNFFVFYSINMSFLGICMRLRTILYRFLHITIIERLDLCVMTPCVDRWLNRRISSFVFGCDIMIG